MATRRLNSPNIRQVLSALLLFALLGAGLTTTLLSSGCAAPESANAAPQAVSVDLFEVNSKPYQDSTELMAQVNSKHATDIHPQVSGRILKVLVSDGELVKAGQPLFQLDTSQQLASVRSLDAIRRASLEEPHILQKNIEGLQADLIAAKAELEFSKKQLARYQELLNEHTVSARDTEQYQTVVHTQEQKVRSILASIASQQSRRKESYANISRDTATLQSASANLAYYTVRAPFTGNVGTLVAKEGDVVDPVSMLTTLTDNRNLEIEVAVSADDRHRIYMGMPMQLLTMRDEPLGEIKTTYIAPNVDSTTQTFLLKAKVENSKNTLAMDQHLKVRLIWGKRDALLVPVVSIMRMDGMTFVYKAETQHQKAEKNKKASDGQVAKLQAVTLGPIINDSVVVLNGLKPGDQVIQSGIQKLQDGAPITATNSSNGQSGQTIIEQE